MGKVAHGAYTRIALNLYDCGGPLRSVRKCARVLRAIIREQGMTMRKVLHDPYGGGNTSFILVITLEESFVLIETWPEIRMVKAIVDLCHFSRNNAVNARRIADGIKQMFSSTEMYCQESINENPGVEIDAEKLAALQ